MTMTDDVTRTQTSQVLVLLYRYVVTNTPSHAALVPAVLVLREGAKQFGRGNVQAGFDMALASYRLVQQVRSSSPDLPLP
jgi:hypothetical protein